MEKVGNPIGWCWSRLLSFSLEKKIINETKENFMLVRLCS
jgi:hypothetical protein